jgi:hypothetical protein
LFVATVVCSCARSFADDLAFGWRKRLVSRRVDDPDEPEKPPADLELADADQLGMTAALGR